MKKSIVLILFLFCFSSFATGKIYEIEKIENVEKYITQDQVIFLNVGGTLFSAPTMLADNQFREYFVARTNNLITHPKTAQAIIDEVKGSIVERIPKVPPEEITPSVLKRLQKNKVPVLGYTQRNFTTTYAPQNGRVTNMHLINMRIFLENAFSYYPATEYHNKSHDFQYGILFTNKNPLGPALIEFFNQTKYPQHVIIVDDHISVLEEAENTLAAHAIETIGLRYNRVDAHKKAFNADVATIQFFAFINDNKFLSDQEALEIKMQNQEVDFQSKLDAWILQRALIAS